MSKGIKITILVGAMVFIGLFLATTFALPARAEAAPYFTPEEIERGLEFSFQRRLLYWTGAALHLAVLAVIVFSGFARKLADAIAGWVGGRWLITVLLVGGFCFLLDEAISLPLGLARLELVRACGELAERSCPGSRHIGRHRRRDPTRALSPHPLVPAHLVGPRGTCWHASRDRLRLYPAGVDLPPVQHLHATGQEAG